MNLTKTDFSNYIKAFNFRQLFNDMGWNNDKTKQPIVVDNETYTLQAVGEKSGFKIMLCNPQPNGLLPDYNTRKKIETKVTKLFQEHLIIFFDTKNTEQIWQLVVRQSGKPTKVTETRWHINQDPELLYQRAAGIFFELDEEDKITIVDVKKRMGDNFQQNNEKVTKAFYDKFKKEHSSFLQFIQGIANKTDQDWYASLMLNRLMFCYFIQKKGFLDNNKNYLRDKLKACTLRQAQGDKSKKFYSFYRDFLLVLFHKGLNEPTQNQDVKIEIGKIPYLNGGLFDEHELEKTHTKIDINDKAFEQLFNFFDQYEWHLDTSVTATGKDINPDVIGYIFEKYINDRANMGAYYTKEDITDYISKNCILPYLFDETFRSLRLRSDSGRLSEAETELWQMVQTSGDKYIYDAVKKGVDFSIRNLELGITNNKEPNKLNIDFVKRNWKAYTGEESYTKEDEKFLIPNLSFLINSPAPDSYALPTEIWREVVDRRNRYTEVKTKIDKGEINTINDFITYNLNIRQFAQDFVENTNDPELLKHFYKALNSVTIIDPTCGSGAFLFAAMNILEPLYEACIQRMRAFTEDEDRKNGEDKKNFKNKYKYFREVLENIQHPQHPNQRYFIYKSIILQNLHGVDIMKEAVEIAKLRLFLKLVATVDADFDKPNFGLEPLPDIDFNIRAGNTLVGFATETELQKGLTYTLDGAIAKPLIEEKCEIVANAFKRYKEIQLSYGDDFKEFKKAKEELNKRLKELNHELNQLLHKQATAYKYEDWLVSHQPFHWFAEFYEIVQGNGGFDVIIGNPPYVEIKKQELISLKLNEIVIDSGNLYSAVMYRCKEIISIKGYFGVIIPLSFISSKQYIGMKKELEKKSSLYYSSYDIRPDHLFDGAAQRLTIVLRIPFKTAIYTEKQLRWYSIFREFLFENINYTLHVFEGQYFFRLSQNSSSILNKINSINYKTLINGDTKIWVATTANNFIKAVNIAPTYLTNGIASKPSGWRIITVDKKLSNVSIALINSNLFYLIWKFTSDGFNLTNSFIEQSLSKFANPDLDNKLKHLALKLSESLKENSEMHTRNQKTTGKTEIQLFRVKAVKPVIDEIDTVLAQHYGFTDEELDFIINYDIKYRMGKELDNGDE